MIKMENICKTFHTFKLNHISMELPKGYICGLIGENGSGKSTLMKILAGIYHMDSGQRTLANMNYDENEVQIKDILGIVFDECFFDKDLTPKAIGKLYGPLYTSFDERVYKENLVRFQLNPKQKLGDMSKGMEMKLQLAFALSHHAKIFLFDEPTASLDQEFREEFWRICASLIEDGEKSILISSHLTGDFDRRADYIAYLDHGELLFFETGEKLSEMFTLVKAENYKLRLIPKENMIHMEEGEYGGMALVVGANRLNHDSAYTLAKPSLREVMYHISRGGVTNAKAILQRNL